MTAAAELFGSDDVEDPTVVGRCGPVVVIVVVVVDVAAAVVDEVSLVTFGMAMGKVDMFKKNGNTL